MKDRSRVLRKIAALAVFVPLAVTVVSQVVVWLIPGCNPNPYALGECAGSVKLALSLLLGELGGLYVALLLGAFVSAPLLVASIVMRLWGRRHAKSAV